MNGVREVGRRDGGAALGNVAHRLIIGQFPRDFDVFGRHAAARLERLTPRELEVLDLMTGGKKNGDIAKDLNISCMGAICPRVMTRTPRGGLPILSSVCLICEAAVPRSSCSTLAVTLR